MISRTFYSECTFSETDSYTIIIVRELALKFYATKVELDDMRYPSCLPVALSAMDATYNFLTFFFLMLISLAVKKFAQDDSQLTLA